MTTDGSVEKHNAALIEVATFSASLANALAQKSTFSIKLAEINSRLEKLAAIEKRAKDSVAAEEATLREAEAAIIRDTESIDGRRVQMYSLGAHVKKSAERDIAEAAVELEARKPVVAALKIKVTGMLEKLKAGLAEQAKEVARLTSEKNELLAEKASAEQRESEARAKLSASVAQLLESNRAIVERTIKKYPSDPSAEMKDLSCTACGGAVSPKLVVDFLNSHHVVRCAECSRFFVAASGRGVTAQVEQK